MELFRNQPFYAKLRTMTTKDHIEKILREKFVVDSLTVEDNSAQHAGHNDDAKKGGTHFSIFIVSKNFAGKKLVERHRLIYDALQNHFEKGLHALAIKAKTPNET